MDEDRGAAGTNSVRDIRGALESAIALHQRGELARAEAVYLGVLQSDADNPDALHYLGVLRHQQGQPLLAIDLVSRAIEVSPAYFDAYNNLGNILKQSGALTDAAKLYEEALTLQPGNPLALRNLGIALAELKRYEEAIELHQRAIAREPTNVESFYLLASAYKSMGCSEKAVATLKDALAIQPSADGFRRLGQMLYSMRKIDEAAAVYQRWLDAEPDNPIARHMLAACTRSNVPQRAENDFVTRIFDGFAESFDRVLHNLEYRAPALVGEALRRALGESTQALEIVDAGCGTGLLGQYLRPYARRLVGIDLSPRMLEKAATRALYDRLVVVELGLFLRTSPECFDVVASSDTLVYFGDLHEPLAAARTSLRPSGLLLFTLERASNDGEDWAGYCLHPHGRYSHGEAYVRKTLNETGFELATIDQAHLRREGMDYVEGLVVTARRRESGA